MWSTEFVSERLWNFLYLPSEDTAAAVSILFKRDWNKKLNIVHIVYNLKHCEPAELESAVYNVSIT